MYFLREQFRKCIFWGSNPENEFFKRAILKKYLLRQFWKCSFWGRNFESVFFEGAILKEANEE